MTNALGNRAGLTILATFALAATPGAGNDADTSFNAQMSAAMTTMTAAMGVKPSGDVDRDFVTSMVPHHQGAIEMAEAELRYGHNDKVRRIAQEIVVTQEQEIVAMHRALQEP